MSAIAGAWSRRAAFRADQACRNMLGAQAIYGPDADDQWGGADVALGRRLRRLLPEDRFDQQPVQSPSGRYLLVADARLDNRDELQAALQVPAVQARQLSDSDLLVSAWDRWGEAVFDHLVGDYAFAVWECEHRRLRLARDPMGSRPLHFHQGPGFFAFASMPKGLLALPEVPRGPDTRTMAEFLALLPETGSRSFFEGVERLEPGSLLTVSEAGVERSFHWRPTRNTVRLRSLDEYVEGLRAHLDQAVSAQLRGAGDCVGAHLSAGLDSAAVAATAARLTANHGGKVVAFTAAPRADYRGPAPAWRFGDESALAMATAALYPNIEHVILRSSGVSPIASADRDFFLYDRPLLNLCNFTWIHGINAEARDRRISVMLVGGNGNLSLSYDGLGALPQLVSEHRWATWWKIAMGLAQTGSLKWPGILFRSLEPWLPGRLRDLLNRARGIGDQGTALYSAAQASVLTGLAAGGRDLDPGPTADPFRARLEAMLWADPGNYHKGALAGWGVDIRDPTADRRLVEFCLGIPTELFLTGGRPRALARLALADRLPEPVLVERSRGYQAIDWHEGLTAAREEVAEATGRLWDCAPARQVLDLARLEGLIGNWPKGGWERREVLVPYRYALLRGLSAGQFLRKATGSNA
jgi:asparagine synthase (glutamine-hydrolysing)